ncbi:MAG: hypothetical protein ABI379_11540 [Rhodanobacter sp.]
MKLDHLKPYGLALAIGAVVLLSGCATMEVGGGKNPVSGSAGGANSANAAPTLEHCDHSLGTLAVEENTSENWYIILTTQYRLPATTPLIRLMVQQSNCFVVVDRGRAMANMMQERALGASGELRNQSNLAVGRWSPRILWSRQVSSSQRIRAAAGQVHWGFLVVLASLPGHC